MDSTTTLTVPSADILDLFNLDVRTAPIAKLPTIGRSAKCTDDTCTATCNSCGCTATCNCK